VYPGGVGVDWGKEMCEWGLTRDRGGDLEFGEELTVIVDIIESKVAFLTKLVVFDEGVDKGLGVIQRVGLCRVGSVKEHLLDKVDQGELTGCGDALGTKAAQLPGCKVVWVRVCNFTASADVVMQKCVVLSEAGGVSPECKAP
jgi:hypothetical protein